MDIHKLFSDVMNHVYCVIKRDVYRQKVYSCYKNICGISFFVLKIPVVYQKKKRKKERKIMGDIAWVFA